MFSFPLYESSPILTNPRSVPKTPALSLGTRCLVVIEFAYVVLDVTSLIPLEMQETETRIKDKQEESKYKHVIIRQAATVVCAQDAKFPTYISSLSCIETPESIYSHPFHFIMRT